jgi:hypothetical protein
MFQALQCVIVHHSNYHDHKTDDSYRFTTLNRMTLSGKQHVNTSPAELRSMMTPSRKRHINSLPTELLIVIFQSYCGLSGFIYSPIVLALVCHLWHGVVTACPTLWGTTIFDLSTISYSKPVINYRYIRYADWFHLDRIFAHAGATSLNVKCQIMGNLHSRDEELILRLFPSCRNLYITVCGSNQSRPAPSIIMPHLEHITITNWGHSSVEPLLDSIERGSPLLSSLIFASFFPNLARHEPLMRRLVHLTLYFKQNSTISLRELHNLEELR